MPHGVYPAAGDDRWLAVVAADDDAWRRLAATGGLGRRPRARHARRAARRATTSTPGSPSGRRRGTAEEAAELLQAAGVSAMPVMGPIDHHADAHLAARGFIVTLEHPEVGPERHVGNPLRLSRLPQRIAASSPCLGADTATVLREHLGLTDDELAALDAAGVLR